MFIERVDGKELYPRGATSISVNRKFCHHFEEKLTFQIEDKCFRIVS